MAKYAKYVALSALPDAVLISLESPPQRVTVL